MRGVMAPPQGRYCFAETDARGNFRLRNHSQTIFFAHGDFQPLTKIVEYSTRRIEVALDKANGTWVVPDCKTSVNYREHPGDFVELSYFYISFFVPVSKDIQFRKVSDADYTLYTFGYGARESRHVLQGWFGLYAADLSSSEKLLIKSVEFNERWARVGAFNARDMRGRSSDGKRWRFFSIDASAIFYENAPEEAASKFDGLLDHMCYQDRIIKK